QQHDDGVHPCVPPGAGPPGAGYLIAFLTILAASASLRSMPRALVRLSRWQATSATSSATAASFTGSLTICRDGSQSTQRKCSMTSAASQAKPSARFFGLWYGSQWRSSLNRRTASRSMAMVVVASGMAHRSRGRVGPGFVSRVLHARAGDYSVRQGGVKGSV